MSLEIERRFLISMPNPMMLMSVCKQVYSIEQVYLHAPEGTTARVRHRIGEREEFFYTEKKFIDGCTSEEQEREISRAEYEQLLERRDKTLQPICKRRFCLVHEDLTFEIDVYPFWRRVAIMEVELESADKKFTFPQGIDVLQEVTEELQLKNVALARSVPPEPFLLKMYGKQE